MKFKGYYKGQYDGELTGWTLFDGKKGKKEIVLLLLTTVASIALLDAIYYILFQFHILKAILIDVRWLVIAAIVAYATSLIREFCHGIAFPDRGAAEMYFSSQFKSVPGLRYLANGFITTDRPFHKGRFLMGLAMPVIITVLIPLAVFTYNRRQEEVTGFHCEHLTLSGILKCEKRGGSNKKAMAI
ncbi:MAG: hypothetical protein PHE79_11730 [Eubacteriales bacterium]|nr:hypothetical protein [Eubacteriales bacterium]